MPATDNPSAKADGATPATPASTTRATGRRRPGADSRTLLPKRGGAAPRQSRGGAMQTQIPAIATAEGERERAWREWMMVGLGLTAVVAVLAVIVGIVALSEGGKGTGSTTAPTPAATASNATAANAAFAPAPTLAQAKGIPYERFQPVDPTLPAVPAGAVKKFTVGVMQHLTQVDPKLAPVEAWTYTVNGTAYRGTAASPPIVVNQGDRVQITFVNGASKTMGVNMSHSIDFHAAHVAPNKYYVDIAPGKSETFSFTASSAGVFMYHCATQPVLTHTGSGMTGMMVVKPHNLPPVARELWVTQQEFYIGKPGGIADQAKLAAENPDVVAFNGYANQYKIAPVSVPAGKPIRMWVLDAGPSKWTAFHVIGTVFDTTSVEGVIGHGSQTISLAPSQGAWVQFTLAEPGNYPFVTHDFGDMSKGAAGMLHTPGAGRAPAPKGAVPRPAGGSASPVPPSMMPASTMPSMSAPSTTAGSETASGAGANATALPPGAVAVTMGEMWIKAPAADVKAGQVTFSVSNTGQMPHRFAVMKAPVKLTAAGTPDTAKGVLAQTETLNPGASATVSASLAAGRYELVCLEPGHYAAGQHTAFKVAP